MWNFLRGKKRTARSEESVSVPDDALSALARERRAAVAGTAASAPSAPSAPSASEAPGAEEPPRMQVPHGYEVVVDRHLDEVGAGIAPEQDEDDLPAVPREHRPLSREDRVADSLDRWSQQITGGVQAPSFLTQIRAGGV